MYICTYVHIYIHIYTCTCIYISFFLYLSLYTHIYVYIYIYIYIYICRYLSIYTIIRTSLFLLLSGSLSLSCSLFSFFVLSFSFSHLFALQGKKMNLREGLPKVKFKYRAIEPRCVPFSHSADAAQVALFCCEGGGVHSLHQQARNSVQSRRVPS